MCSKTLYDALSVVEKTGHDDSRERTPRRSWSTAAGHGRESGIRGRERLVVRATGHSGVRDVRAFVVRVRGRVPDVVLGGHRVQRDGAYERSDQRPVAIAVCRARVRPVRTMRHGRSGRPLRGHQRTIAAAQRRWWKRKRGPVPRSGHSDGCAVHRPADHVRRPGRD